LPTKEKREKIRGERKRKVLPTKLTREGINAK